MTPLAPAALLGRAMISSRPAVPADNFVFADSLLAAIVESSDDAIVSQDLHGTVLSWNAAAERMFGYTAGEMIGQPTLRLVPGDRPAEESELLHRLRNGERIDQFETVRLTRTGGPVEVSLNFAPVRNRAGEVVGASLIARNITARKEAERALLQSHAEAEASAAEAERLARLKDDFLATLSHELRTPLQAILGWTQLLLAGPVEPADLQQGLTVIQRNARAQSRIVDDLLDMSRILTGDFEMDLGEHDFAEIVEKSLTEARVLATAHGLKLVTEIQPGSMPVLGDAVRLGQVLDNLLNNAIKFTPAAGEISVQVRMADDWITFTLRDTGIGIDPDFLPYVFECFRQADPSFRRNHGGLGLGLSIVKTLVELHDGTIHAASEGEGHGTVFTLDLPVAEMALLDVSAAVTTEQGEPRRLPRLDGISLLVVDDEVDARDMLRRVLGTLGAEVRTASSAAEALDEIAAAVPDLVISDLGMPGRDGFDLIRSIRALPAEEGGRVPALALTAYTGNDDRVRAVTEGFQMYLAKPTDAMELLGMVKVLTRSTVA